MPVRVAFVLGFYDVVQAEILATLSREVRARSVICIGPVKPGGPPDLSRFSSLLYDHLARGATHVLVLAAIVRSKDKLWLEPSIKSMVIEGERRFTSATVSVQFERDARAAGLVVGKLKEFAPTVPDLITCEHVREKLRGMRVLCIREKHTTSFRSALERQGFESGVYEEHFTEHSSEASSNPNSLREKVRAHRYVMYAFEGFGHSFGRCLDGHDGVLFKQGRAAACVADFKEWLLKSD